MDRCGAGGAAHCGRGGERGSDVFLSVPSCGPGMKLEPGDLKRSGEIFLYVGMAWVVSSGVSAPPRKPLLWGE